MEITATFLSIHHRAMLLWFITTVHLLALAPSLNLDPRFSGRLIHVDKLPSLTRYWNLLGLSLHLHDPLSCHILPACLQYICVYAAHISLNTTTSYTTHRAEVAVLAVVLRQ